MASSKVAHYLQEHLVGEVMTGTDARLYFATDAGMLQLAPALIAYPRNENDIRKTCRFTWQLAERNRIIPVTARGSGTDQTGAALGSGVVLVFTAHMNRILELDTKANTVTVEPGINFGKLQQTLHTHGRFLPPYPASLEYSSVGGAIANNSTGVKSLKYGDMRNYVRSLRVVLANGEVIETGRISKRELSKKLGLATFEGEIYRSLDALLEEQRELVEQLTRPVPHNNAGYALSDVKRHDGSFDLTPLFVGSQGTLGIVAEAVLLTETHNPQTNLLLAAFDSLDKLQSAVNELRAMKDSPSALELIDGNLLQRIQTLNPNQLKEIITPPFPAALLLIEFDDPERHLKKTTKRANKILNTHGTNIQTATTPDQQQLLWKLRDAAGTLISHNEGLLRDLPVIDGAAVPADQLSTYLDGIYRLLQAANLPAAVWGHAGDGRLHFQTLLNAGQVGDRQKIFRLMDEHAKLVFSLGGTISGEAGDGRLHTPYLETMYGTELYDLLGKVKKIFDPYGTLNPGVKFGTSIDDLKAIIRADYKLDHLYDHLPRS